MSRSVSKRIFLLAAVAACVAGSSAVSLADVPTAPGPAPAPAPATTHPKLIAFEQHAAQAIAARRITVQVDGVTIPGVLSVDGLTALHEFVRPHADDGVSVTFENGDPRRPLVIGRLLDADRTLFNWIKETQDGKVARARSVTVTLNSANANAGPVERITLKNALPISRSVSVQPDPKGGSSKPVEFIKITFTQVFVSG